MAADWLTSAWGQNTGNAHATPAAAACEEVAGAWLLDLLDLPRECSVGFVTGATIANFTCLAAARGEVLRRVGWDVRSRRPVRRAAGACRARRRSALDRVLGAANIWASAQSASSACRSTIRGACAPTRLRAAIAQARRADHRHRAGRAHQFRRVRSVRRDSPSGACERARGCTSMAPSACGRARAGSRASRHAGFELADSWGDGRPQMAADAVR